MIRSSGIRQSKGTMRRLLVATIEVTVRRADVGEGEPATGNRFSVRGVSVLELERGKIRRISDYWDMAAFLRQLGILPEKPGED